MASSNSRPWICMPNHREERCPADQRRSCRQARHSSAGGDISGGKARLLKLDGGAGLGVAGRRRSEKKGTVAGAAASSGCRWDEGGGDGYRYGITAEQRTFVDGIREAQPYVHAHRGRTFIVILSGEIVAGGCLDSILKVSSHLPPLSKSKQRSPKTTLNLSVE
ncbi:hypothetical protein NL676_013703 [Syzygium grande]|nr:hypothetical protein NL676_013703 [Syzygium grande]